MHHLHEALTPERPLESKGNRKVWIDAISRHMPSVDASVISRWISGERSCEGSALQALLNTIEVTHHGKSAHGEAKEICKALQFFYKHPDGSATPPADVPVPVLAQAYLDRLAPKPAADSVRPPSVLDSLLARWSDVAFQASHLAPTSCAVLAARRGDLFHTFGQPAAASMQLQWLPVGTVRMPDQSLARVERPVAMLFQAVDRALAGLEGGAGGKALQMATSVSLDDVRRHAERLTAQTGKHWRLPRAAEWWMAMTAGTGRPPHAGSSGGLWLDEVPLNAWEIRPPPPTAMEWVADEGLPTGAIGAVGQRQPIRADIRLPMVGYRLVIDWFRES